MDSSSRLRKKWLTVALIQTNGTEYNEVLTTIINHFKEYPYSGFGEEEWRREHNKYECLKAQAEKYLKRNNIKAIVVLSTIIGILGTAMSGIFGDTPSGQSLIGIALFIDAIVLLIGALCILYRTRKNHNLIIYYDEIMRYIKDVFVAPEHKVDHTEGINTSVL